MSSLLSCSPAWLGHVRYKSILHSSLICSMLPNIPHPPFPKKKSWNKVMSITKMRKHIIYTIIPFQSYFLLGKDTTHIRILFGRKARSQRLVYSYVLLFVLKIGLLNYTVLKLPAELAKTNPGPPPLEILYQQVWKRVRAESSFLTITQMMHI